MEFTDCMNIVFTWKSSRLAKMSLYVPLQNVAAWINNFVCAFVDVTVVSRNDERFLIYED